MPVALQGGEVFVVECALSDSIQRVEKSAKWICKRYAVRTRPPRQRLRSNGEAFTDPPGRLVADPYTGTKRPSRRMTTSVGGLGGWSVDYNATFGQMRVRAVGSPALPIPATTTDCAGALRTSRAARNRGGQKSTRVEKFYN